MPAASNVQTSFLGGEWSQLAQGLMDDPLYRKGLNRCLNYIPVEEESLVRRSGTRMGGPTRLGVAGRVMSFPIAQDDPYDLEFTADHLRFWQSGRLVTESATSLVTDISTATPAVVELGSAVTWATDDIVIFTMQSPTTSQALAKITNRQFKVIKIDTTHFALFDGITGAAVDGSEVSWSTLLICRAEKAVDLSTPYTDAEWEDVRKIQSENPNGQATLLLLHRSYVPRLLTATPSDTGYATFAALSSADFTDGPYLDPVNGLSTTTGYTVTPSGTSGSINLTISDAAAINDGQGFLSTDVGRLVRIKEASAWSWAQITARTSATVAVATVRGANLGGTSATYEWRMGAYSATTGYPTCGCYADGRIWLGGAIKNRFDASMSNRPFDFTPTAAAGTVADNNAITYTFNSSDSNQITWMAPVDEGLSAGTLAGEWLVRPASTTAGLTPTNIKADRVTRYGSAAIEPARTGLTTVFVQKYKRKLLEFLSDGATNKYFAPNLSKYAKHLTKDGIEEIAYQEELAPIVWARTGSGKLIGTTYKRVSMYSSQTPLFNGWHRHEHGGEHEVVSIATGPTTDGLLEQLTVCTRNPTTDRYYVEVMRSLFQETDTIETSWFVDAGIVPSCAVTYTSGGVTGLRFHGLWELNGQTLACVVGGIDCGDFLVRDGYMEVPYSGLFTANKVNSLTIAGEDYGDMAVTVDAGMATIPVVVGYAFTSQGQRLRPVAQADTGAANGPGFGKLRRNHKFAAQLTNTQGVSFGTVFGKLKPAIFKTNLGVSLPLTTLFSGVHRDSMQDEYSTEGMQAWEQTRPYPGTINAIGGNLQTQDE